MKHNRLDGEEYFDMLDEFISACYARWYVVMRLVFSQTHTHTHTHTAGPTSSYNSRISAVTKQVSYWIDTKTIVCVSMMIYKVQEQYV